MKKLFMIQAALNNLVASGKATIHEMEWRIRVGDHSTLFIDCGDENFEYRFLYSADSEETWGKKEVLETVSELKDLMAEVDDDEI